MNLSFCLAIAALIVISTTLSCAYTMPTGSLTCFSRPKGADTKVCPKIHGFRTCYTRYNIKGKLTGRGCSTQMPNFKACDTHKYGQKKSEKYCYCTENFCNSCCLSLPSTTTTLVCLVWSFTWNEAYLLATIWHTCQTCQIALCRLCCHLADLLARLAGQLKTEYRKRRT